MFEKRHINVFKFEVAQWLRIDVLPFNYDYGNKKKYTRFYHTEGFTHHDSSFVGLEVIKTHPKNDHVNKPSCFGHWF